MHVQSRGAGALRSYAALLRRGALLIAAACASMLAAGNVPRDANSAESIGTFSIVARDSLTGELGVAVQSRAFSVGSGVSWARAGIGAVATQATTNESFGPRALDLLEAGLSADEALAHLIGHDADAEHRQLAIIDSQGRIAAHTGRQCLDWAGNISGPDVSCQGNILAGEAVIVAMRDAFMHTEGELARKLLAALEAGQAAGGDRRGQQSAALLVVRDSDTFPEYRSRYVDLRVEDHEQPIAELARVFAYHEATDLVRAHLRFAERYDAEERPGLARRERERVGQALENALARGEDDANLLNGLAWFTALSGLYLDEALVAAERAAALSPESYEILDTLAEVHYRRGEIDQAVSIATRALELEPDSTYLQEQLERFRSGAVTR